MASLDAITHWDHEADVIVLGCGLAGMVAALESQETDPGASVMILEKMPESEAGGNSRVSGQSLSFPDDMAAYRRYQEALNQPHPIPERLMTAWVEGRTGQMDWVKQKAAEVGFELAPWGAFGAEFPHLPGAECIKGLYTLQPASGLDEAPRLERPYPSGVYLCFRRHLDRTTAISVHYGTRALELIYDQDTSEVFGVIAEQDGKRLAVKARRAVIMTMGGYEASPEMLGTYSGYTSDVCIYGSPANTGDGITMLQRVGAKLWHMRNHTETGGNHPGIKVPGYGAFIRNPRPKATSWIDVGRNGRRFYPEAGEYHDTHFKYELHGRWEDVPTARVTPVHMIFDENARRTDTLVARTLAWGFIVDGYQWSDDNKAEIEKGWIHKADTIAELAARIGRDPHALVREVETYNEYARTGHDPVFGRAPDRMTPIEEGPFYAVEIVAGLICTTGGGLRDEHGRVLDNSEQPIPRLYEAGELGSFHANLYQNGSFLTEAMFSGRWAGANAVREKPWC